VATDPGAVGCYSARYGCWQGLAIGYDVDTPAPVSFVAVGVNVSAVLAGAQLVLGVICLAAPLFGADAGTPAMVQSRQIRMRWLERQNVI
jgi:hypothetical protein